jgi:hypothetical protein
LLVAFFADQVYKVFVLLQEIMRNRFWFAILTCSLLAGCHATQPSIAREALVGNYIYKSEDPEAKATDHNLEHLVLKSDGQYDLVQGGSTRPRTEIVGRWSIWDVGNDGPEVLLDHSGYPIQIKGNEVRLLVDNDVGIWYSKTQ